MKWIAVLTMFALVGLVIGCGGESVTTSGKGPGGEEMKLTLNGPKDTSIKPGDTATITVGVDRKNFNDDVSLEFEGLPDGVSIVGDKKIVKNKDDVELTLRAEDDAKPVEDKVVKVTAKGGKMTTPPAEFKVTVKKKD